MKGNCLCLLKSLDVCNHHRQDDFKLDSYSHTHFILGFTEMFSQFSIRSHEYISPGLSHAICFVVKCINCWVNEWHQFNEWVDLDCNIASNTRLHQPPESLTGSWWWAPFVYSLHSSQSGLVETIQIMYFLDVFLWWIVYWGLFHSAFLYANARKTNFTIKLSSPNYRHPSHIWKTS